VLPQFNRWYRRRRSRQRPAEQVYDASPYETQVIGIEHDAAEVERQLAHANEQLELQSRYPGRSPR
jgi:hypothetical protein